jgi:hypothetical protein
MFWFIYDHSQVLQSSQKYVQSVAECGLKLACSMLKFPSCINVYCKLKISSALYNNYALYVIYSVKT